MKTEFSKTVPETTINDLSMKHQIWQSNMHFVWGLDQHIILNLSPSTTKIKTDDIQKLIFFKKNGEASTLDAPPQAQAFMVSACAWEGASMMDAPPQVQAPVMDACACGGTSMVDASQSLIFFFS